MDIVTTKTMSSREIATMTGKQHKNVIRDIEKLNDNYQELGMLKIEQGYYTLPNTGNQQHKQYNLTKIQTMDLMTGYRTDLRIKINRRWEELESKENSIHSIPSTLSQALRLAAEQAEKIEYQQLLLDNQKPKVLFAEAVSASHSTILVGDLAKLLKQNQINIGANRLFEYLRENGYLIKRKGTDYNMPTQKAMDLGLFQIKETTINRSEGILIQKTTKVTGKGQSYFINHFLKQNNGCITTESN